MNKLYMLIKVNQTHLLTTKGSIIEFPSIISMDKSEFIFTSKEEAINLRKALCKFSYDLIEGTEGSLDDIIESYKQLSEKINFGKIN